MLEGFSVTTVAFLFDRHGSRLFCHNHDASEKREQILQGNAITAV
jgi:hypothetical protein